MFKNKKIKHKCYDDERSYLISNTVCNLMFGISLVLMAVILICTWKLYYL